ncbi:sigma-E factor negative regulatory protein [Roseateles sp.]|uniref:sigma-E factor negative regulatory protein n=1 Tax=Roseateles sp. TaxID=1971397 RepID=UPI003267A155
MRSPDNDALDGDLQEALSAVMDGRATPAEWARVNAAWAADATLRERWALWHAAGDGLRSAELPALHREPHTLLDALHAQMPAPLLAHPRGRDWFAPFAVAAGFVAVAIGIGALRTPASPDTLAAAAPFATPRAQGLAGMSFAQTAAGRTLPSLSGSHEAGVLVNVPPEIIDWGLALPEQAASRPAQ